MSAYRTSSAPRPETKRGYELIVAPGDGFTRPWVTRSWRWRWLARVMAFIWVVLHPYGMARLRDGDEEPEW